MPYFSDQLVLIGRNTYAVMMHHIFAFFLVKSVFYVVSILTPLCGEFDAAMYFSEINFIYLPGGAEAGKWIYLLAGIGIPLLIAGLTGRAWRRFGRLVTGGRDSDDRSREGNLRKIK